MWVSAPPLRVGDAWAGGAGPGVSDETPVGPPLVEVRDASVVLGGRRVWSDVNATVTPGEFVAILGPNGVGKSTLLKAILGLVPEVRGRGTPLGRPPPQANREGGHLP